MATKIEIYSDLIVAGYGLVLPGEVVEFPDDVALELTDTGRAVVSVAELTAGRGPWRYPQSE